MRIIRYDKILADNLYFSQIKQVWIKGVKTFVGSFELYHKRAKYLASGIGSLLKKSFLF